MKLRVRPLLGFMIFCIVFLSLAEALSAVESFFGNLDIIGRFVGFLFFIAILLVGWTGLGIVFSNIDVVEKA